MGGKAFAVLGAALLFCSSEVLGVVTTQTDPTIGLTAGDGCTSAAESAFWKSSGYDSYEADSSGCAKYYSVLGVETSLQRDSITACMRDMDNNCQRASFDPSVQICQDNCTQSTPGCDCCNREGDEDENLYRGLQGFSQPCASCMATLIICSGDQCGLECAGQGKSGNICRDCVQSNCFAEFYECSGIDVTCDPNSSEECYPTELNVALVAGVGGGVFALLITLGLCIAIKKHSANLAASREQFAKDLMLAASMAPQVTAPVPVFEMDTEMNNSLNAPLRTLYAFEADHESELSIVANESLTGIQIIDEEWWLARNEAGEVGLVPRSYVDEEDAGPPAGGGGAAIQDEDEDVEF